MKDSSNSLAILYPEIAKEWHPTKNGDLTPDMVSARSDKKVWWYMPYDDPSTGKHFDFEWEAIVKNRTRGQGCPFLVGKQVWVGFNDLATTDPQLAREWHPTKNGNITPQMVSRSSQKKYWWIFPYDDPRTGKHYDFEWEANVGSRSAGRGCPYLTGKAVYPGFNDFASINPEIAKEWHPTKNGHLKPDMFTVNSLKKIWWLGKCGHEWEASISHRSRGHGCIYCASSNPKLLEGFNDLETTYPEIAKEWHPTKNGELTPKDVSARSPKKVWWQGKCGHEWMATVHNRTGDTPRGCPICAKEYKSSFPEQALFYYIRMVFPDAINGDKKALGGKELDIFIPSVKVGMEYDGYSWHRDLNERDTEKANACREQGIRLIRVREEGLQPIDGCENIIADRGLERAIEEVFSRLNKTIEIDLERDRAKIVRQFTNQRKRHKWWEEYPEVLAEWDYEKNGELTPYLTMQKDSVWWKCKKCGFEWKVDVSKRVKQKTGCPKCGITKTAKARQRRIRNIDTGEVFNSMKEACERYDIASANMTKCCKGERKKARGYRWEYYEEGTKTSDA